ncbi:hypothetical protein BJI67_07055 [Acidihalobacter aeolianus]|uniref:N-acetyltransferase domain-containing protein n=1 Tax=Acidihalobacter aeolianus TaxID=2792603 RepID=A0A1D8K7B5_9GAMM|nr:GNAT family N-acetyltransferase [Acidihalobacter aeolianus]AOV16851.1 hypothetical protein BJI67_07055 [Acidihalobacter aeolianus]
MSLQFTTLDRLEHDRRSFDAGTGDGRETLTDYLRTKAAKHQDQHVCRVFVLTDDTAPKRIIGYYTLSNGEIAWDSLSEDEAPKLPRHPLGVIVLGRLAVDHTEQRRGYGPQLLMDALWRTARVSEHSSVYAMVTDPLNESAAGFYRKYGFMPLPGNPGRLYIPIATVLKSIPPTT